MIKLVPFNPFINNDEIWNDVYVDDNWIGSARTEKQVNESIANWRKKNKLL